MHQSGTSVNGRGSISKRGNHQLRTVLFNAAFAARQSNPAFKAYFEKKRSEGKHYLSALAAVERKLVHVIWAVWTRGTPFVRKIWPSGSVMKNARSRRTLLSLWGYRI
jgi:transposase